MQKGIPLDKYCIGCKYYTKITDGVRYCSYMFRTESAERWMSGKCQRKTFYRKGIRSMFQLMQTDAFAVAKLFQRAGWFVPIASLQ